MILFLSELKLVLSSSSGGNTPPLSLPPLPPRTNRKHSRPDHARAIKVEINIANTTFTAPRILARSCLSWNWFFVFQPKLVFWLAEWNVEFPAWPPGPGLKVCNLKQSAIKFAVSQRLLCKLFPGLSNYNEKVNCELILHVEVVFALKIFFSWFQ